MLFSETPEWFEGTRAYKKLSSESQRLYSRHLRKLLAFVDPETPLTSLDAEGVDSLYESLVDSLGEHAAVTICKIWRRAYNIAERYGAADYNPFAKMGLPSLPGREIIPTKDQLNTFIHGCNTIGRTSCGLLAELCYVFCQRPVDMRLLKWANYDGETIRFIQQKTGTKMVEWVPHFMRDILDAKKHVSDYIIVREDTLKPYTSRDYNFVVDEVRRITGLPESFQLRDLRRMGLTEAGDNEATDQEIDSLSGHLSPAMRGVYVKRTLQQSKSAMMKRF
jgi:integrase